MKVFISYSSRDVELAANGRQSRLREADDLLALTGEAGEAQAVQPVRGILIALEYEVESLSRQAGRRVERDGPSARAICGFHLSGLRKRSRLEA